MIREGAELIENKPKKRRLKKNTEKGGKKSEKKRKDKKKEENEEEKMEIEEEKKEIEETDNIERLFEELKAQPQEYANVKSRHPASKPQHRIPAPKPPPAEDTDSDGTEILSDTAQTQILGPPGKYSEEKTQLLPPTNLIQAQTQMQSQTQLIPPTLEQETQKISNTNTFTDKTQQICQTFGITDKTQLIPTQAFLPLSIKKHKAPEATLALETQLIQQSFDATVPINQSQLHFSPKPKPKPSTKHTQSQLQKQKQKEKEAEGVGVGVGETLIKPTEYFENFSFMHKNKNRKTLKEKQLEEPEKEKVIEKGKGMRLPVQRVF